MKLQLAVATGILLASSSNAAECTQPQLQSFDKIGSDPAFEKACAKTLAAAASTTTAEANTFANLNPCNDAPCIAYYKSLATDIPDCEIAGISVKASFELVLSLCKGIPTDMTMMPSGPTMTPAPDSTSAGTSGSGSTMTPAPNSTSAETSGSLADSATEPSVTTAPSPTSTNTLPIPTPTSSSSTLAMAAIGLVAPLVAFVFAV